MRHGKGELSGSWTPPRAALEPVRALPSLFLPSPSQWSPPASCPTQPVSAKRYCMVVSWRRMDLAEEAMPAPFPRDTTYPRQTQGHQPLSSRLREHRSQMVMVRFSPVRTERRAVRRPSLQHRPDDRNPAKLQFQPRMNPICLLRCGWDRRGRASPPKVYSLGHRTRACPSSSRHSAANKDRWGGMSRRLRV